MPIHYACILSTQKNVVLQGMYSQTVTNFRTQIVQYAGAIKEYQYSEQPLQNNLRILYHNMGAITQAIVISNEIDRQECSEFLERFKYYVDTELLGKQGGNYQAPSQIQMNSSSGTDTDTQLYLPFQTSTAEATFRKYQPKIDQLVSQWNDDPNNRSKMGQLRQSLEETKAVVMDDLEQTLIRGQNLQKTQEKSEALAE